MSQIYLTAAIFTALGFFLWSRMVRKFPPGVPASILWMTFLICLPLEPLSFFLMRLPLKGWVEGLLPDWKPYLLLLWAPLTEDTFKLLPLLVPAIRRQLQENHWATLALAIGMGFGIGEGWLIAHFIAADPAGNGYPFYAYGGFLAERLEVCICHAFFTSLALRRWGKGFPLGVALAMTTHLLFNSTILLLIYNVGGLGKIFWTTILGFWTLGVTCFAGYQLAQAVLGPVSLGRVLLGRARCPGCQQIYDRPLLAANLGVKRYERCPHCKKWHMTGVEHSVQDEQDS